MNIHDRASIEIRGKNIVVLGLALSGPGEKPSPAEIRGGRQG